ncbi:helix-turn-helix domain-containing protein [Pararobbsia silviterrae]|uniref:AraC family transcriptional regulator n=1 Tax=Pararobbsia silviterrae TaxID=1792498 RepID=A0A494XYT8_9BURK|nr:AraC family transcriptional regulator [Pararobbsia silviterrae]RKP55682.1 AraC family transcriptional regulator [Pararobbsia silviterrae]
MRTPLPFEPELSEGRGTTHAAWSAPYDFARALRHHTDVTPRAFESSGTTDTPCIADETAWRILPRSGPTPVRSAHAGVRFSRWRDAHEYGGEYQCQAEAGIYTLGIALQPTDAVLVVDGRRVHESALRVGSILASGPGQHWHAEFRRRSDFLHVHYDPEFLSDCIERSTGRRLDIGELFVSPVVLVDNITLDLARSLIASAESSTGFAEVTAHALGTAIAARVLELLHETPRLSRMLAQGARQPAGPATLAPWRMRKVLAFIDANLGRPLSLQTIADASGLSKMHFAALFRASTGLSPSEFVAQRRIERAQDLLRTTPMQVVDVAFSLGFQTQAHFSTVFKRLIGEAPSEWRRRHAAGDALHEASLTQA